MKLAFELAKKGEGFVSPNPMVGCVIVKNNKIIGQGYHQQYGKPHAEVNALNSCTVSPENSQVYVTLEPCSHFGKTPPCAERLVKEKVKKVFIATKDPNPLVGGKGIEILQKNNIEVEVGILDKEARQLNKVFFHNMSTEMPYIILKSAVSLDGFIADINNSSKWISSESSRKEVHTLRSKVDAVLVGAGTVMADNPLLTVRFVKGRNPKKIVIDLKGKLNGNYKLFDRNTIYVSVEKNIHRQNLKTIEKTNTKIMLFKEFNVEKMLKEFVKINIASILVEGGAFTSGIFLENGFVNELVIYQAPIVLGRGKSLFKLTKERTMENKIVLGTEDNKICLRGLWKK
jgi:diaminohydroxyphosphoribosylaminopyrimidine deaminase/5-amino-6-(5-phosphoribosylamino)uracil reductase